MTAPTPTPDPLARFRELVEQFPHHRECAYCAVSASTHRADFRKCDCYRDPIVSALLAEAERLVEERDARPNCSPEYVESLRTQAEHERASAQHRLLINADLLRRIRALESLRPATTEGRSE